MQTGLEKALPRFCQASDRKSFTDAPRPYVVSRDTRVEPQDFHHREKSRIAHDEIMMVTRPKPQWMLRNPRGPS